jgi:2-C-methyl-D-erythritol 4-phosphate cytidylyltransferase
MSKLPDRAQVSVLIPAAGSGERLGRGPKAMLPLHGRPVVDWVVDKALQLGDEVLVACPEGVPAPAGAHRVQGGATRQHSVRQLAARATRPWIVLWDAASPFASVELARSVLVAAGDTGASTTCTPSEVPWLVLAHGRVQHAHPAGFAASSQTPQAYRRELLLGALEQAEADGYAAQSTVQLVLHAGHAVRAVAGEKLNLKLTTSEDWLLAEALHSRLLR